VPDSYKVEKGDNPYNIAKKFGISYQELLTLNGIDDPTKLQIGQSLKIPRKAN
jgi:LysM repeat protein